MKKHSPSAAPRGPRTKLRTFADYREDAFARRVVGILSLSRGGVGFVAPDGGGDDILVPEERVGAALPGDRVELALLPPERGSSRVTGRVVRVVERGAQFGRGRFQLIKFFGVSIGNTHRWSMWSF